MKTDEKLRVVLDTNAVLDALSPKLPFRSMLRSLFDGQFELFVSTEILLDYEEKITEFYSKQTAETLLDAFLMTRHVQKTNPHFRFNLIQDLDDNKFLDCAFAANAHLIVTSDRAFRILKNLDFPKIKPVSPAEFLEILQPAMR